MIVQGQPIAVILDWLIPVALNTIIGIPIAKHLGFQQQYD
jgi:hypothetical protein